MRTTEECIKYKHILRAANRISKKKRRRRRRKRKGKAMMSSTLRWARFCSLCASEYIISTPRRRERVSFITTENVGCTFDANLSNGWVVIDRLGACFGPVLAAHNALSIYEPTEWCTELFLLLLLLLSCTTTVSPRRRMRRRIRIPAESQLGKPVNRLIKRVSPLYGELVRLRSQTGDGDDRAKKISINPT